MICAASAHGFFFWGGWSSLVAIGTLALAAGTFWLAVQARAGAKVAREQAHTLKEQLGFHWAHEWAAQRPVVYPVLEPNWVRAARSHRHHILPLKNGGQGPALNVSGEVTCTSLHGNEVRLAIIAGTIAAGDRLDARLASEGVREWDGAHVVIRYGDLAEGGYTDRFEFSHLEGTDELVVTMRESEHVTPEQNRPEQTS